VNAARGILVLLALGLAFRLIIAYLLPGSGFGVDVTSFRFWASNLASQGLSGFYDRDFFHDYTPGYLYVLWLVGTIGNFLGGIGDLIKIPPILGDLGLAYLVWSMTKELGGTERAARIGALIVILNPVTWFDSVVWGQVDSVGVVVLLLALRELWRDRPERAAILATLAALVKPQLGIRIRRRGRAGAARVDDGLGAPCSGPHSDPDHRCRRLPDRDPRLAPVRAQPAWPRRPDLQDRRGLSVRDRQRLQPVGADHPDDSRRSPAGPCPGPDVGLRFDDHRVAGRGLPHRRLGPVELAGEHGDM